MAKPKTTQMMAMLAKIADGRILLAVDGMFIGQLQEVGSDSGTGSRFTV
jgi:hypothetical protein